MLQQSINSPEVGKTEYSIGIIMPYSTKPANVFLKSLITIMDKEFQKIYLISTTLDDDPFFKKFLPISISVPIEKNSILRIFYFIKIQFIVTYHIFRLRKINKLWLLYLGGETLLVPLVFSKYCNVKIYLMLGGALEKETAFSKDPLVKILKIYYRLSLRLSDKIIIYSTSLMDKWHLYEYKEKILVFPRHYINFKEFSVMKPYDERDKIVGYIGVFSKLKGVHNLIESIKKLVCLDSEIKFFFIGSGELYHELVKLSKNPLLKNRLILHHWIEHKDIPYYLNMMRLLVLPSYSEGLPNIMLEAMACGTPVLATPVGAVPDVILDRQTGFIIENNTPECITKTILQVIDLWDLEFVAERGRKFVEQEFTFEKTIEKWERIFQTINK